MSMVIYLDGEFVPKEEAKVSVFDHGFLYGDGVFEGIRIYNNCVFKLKEHIDRLYEGAHALCLKVNETKEEMEQVVIDTCKKNNLSEGYIRIVISRGVGDLGLDPVKCPKTTTVCIANTITLYPQAMYDNGLKIVTVSTRRNLGEACNPRVKSLNYLNNIYAKMEANLAGAGEGIFLNQEGYVSEATGDNIFIIRKGVIITPPVYAGLLEGITRNCVIDLAREQGYTVKEELFNRMDMYTADEVFLTGSAAEIIAACQYDGRSIGSGKPGPITKGLIASYKDYINNSKDGVMII